MNILNKLQNGLNDAHLKYEAARGLIEAEFTKYIDFEFSIVYQYSDGHVLLHADSASVAPLNICIDHIKEYRKLSEKEFMRYVI